MPKQKHFALRADQIRKLAPDQGSCLASDMITVAGHKVGYMYREEPDSESDSGWRFFSGEETQEYIDDPDNLALYDLNTIANCDPEIIPFLNEPVGLAYERASGGNGFNKVEMPGTG